MRNTFLPMLLAVLILAAVSSCTVTPAGSTPISGAPTEAPTPESSVPTPPSAPSAEPAVSEESEAPAIAETPAAPETISVDQEFSSGNYTAGVDFPAGKYDIIAVEGGGNVVSSNLFSGGINAVMGTEEMNETIDMYEQEYSNIDLPSGTVLSISGVTVRLTCDAADGAPLTPRDQEITETVELGNGNFTSGEDFAPGVYDIVAVSGGGNVSSSNMFDGGLNAVMGTEDQNKMIDMYEQQYKNIDLPEGVTLTISGVKIQLIPSV